MKYQELQRLLNEVGLEEEMIQKRVIGELLNDFKAKVIDKDRFIAEMVILGYMKSDAVLKMKKAPLKILEHVSIIVR